MMLFSTWFVYGVQPVQLRHLALELARLRIRLARIARDVDVRCVVRVDGERCLVVELRPDHRAQVAVDLADAGVVAGRDDAIAARGRRLVSDKVVALVDGEDEERVALVDAVGGQAVEELLEREVVVVQLLDVSSLTGAVREVNVAGRAMPVVRVRDVRVTEPGPPDKVDASTKRLRFQEAHALVHRRERGARQRTRLFGADRQQTLQLGRLGS